MSFIFGQSSEGVIIARVVNRWVSIQQWRQRRDESELERSGIVLRLRLMISMKWKRVDVTQGIVDVAVGDEC